MCGFENKILDGLLRPRVLNRTRNKRKLRACKCFQEDVSPPIANQLWYDIFFQLCCRAGPNPIAAEEAPTLHLEGEDVGKVRGLG